MHNNLPQSLWLKTEPLSVWILGVHREGPRGSLSLPLMPGAWAEEGTGDHLQGWAPGVGVPGAVSVEQVASALKSLCRFPCSVGAAAGNLWMGLASRTTLTPGLGGGSSETRPQRAAL